MAICEFLEEAYPELPKLMPDAGDIPMQKFEVRRLCEIINSGTQPIQNLSVLTEIGARFGAE